MKGFVYIIRSHQTDDVYYGSTTQLLCQRIAGHRRDYKNWLNGKGRKMSSCEIIKYDDAYIELVEEFIFENKQELRAREGYYIRENNCINKQIAGRTTKQYHEEHKDIYKQQHKQYAETHKTEIAEYHKQYVEANKDKIKEYKKRWRESKLLKNILKVVPDVVIS